MRTRLLAVLQIMKSAGLDRRAVASFLRRRAKVLTSISAVVLVLSFAVFRDDGPVLDPGERSSTATTTTAPPPSGPMGRWRLLFSDEFSGDSLEDSRWSRCYPWGSPNGCTNPPNKELQWYERDNVSVERGALRLQAQREDASDDDGKRFKYTSGMVTTGPEAGQPYDPPKFAFTYGYTEARINVPSGRGLWPAVWLLPVSQTWPPEIDVVEVLGHDTTTAHLTTHFGSSDTPKKEAGSARGTDWAKDFHTFGVDWQPDSITWYVDGVERFRTNDPEHVPDVPMYALLNLAVGGEWPGSPDNYTDFPSDYSVDWVRVWQRA